MFDRCDTDTIAVVDTAGAEARRYGHSWLGTEHLLLALVQHQVRLPEGVAHLLPTEAGVRTALALCTDGPPAPEADLLATLGIDLDEVRTSVRGTFGLDALDRLGSRWVHQPWQPWRRPTRRWVSVLAGTAAALAPRAKQAFELALSHAERRGRAVIDPAGLLLGMLDVEGAMSNRLLRDAGVALDDLRGALHDADR